MVSTPKVLYGLYERKLLRSIDRQTIPRHIAVMLDGNRRWAKNAGVDSAQGWQAGADHIEEFLGWCEEADVQLVTLWMLSADNLRGRPQDELETLLQIIPETVTQMADEQRWRLQIVGDMNLLPATIAEQILAEAARTENVKGLHVNIAVGYGGRDEITEAVRSLLRTQAATGKPLELVAAEITADDIADHLYTKGQPDPDLVIRTSGEQRLSGFLMWQSVHSEFYFCEAYWPDFRRVDFLRALRDYSQRERRLGR